MANDEKSERRSSTDRWDRSRDNDNIGDPLHPDYQAEVMPDTKFKARGKARRNVGNTARGTDAHPTGPEGNDKTKGKDE